jgi:hypothetical protein
MPRDFHGDAHLVAKRVVLLTVEGSINSGPSAKDALAHLEAHGIAATEKAIGTRGRRPGEVILAEARAQGADLLIKGAYTQSRLRQMIFGGATQHVLAAAELPVLVTSVVAVASLRFAASAIIRSRPRTANTLAVTIKPSFVPRAKPAMTPGISLCRWMLSALTSTPSDGAVA